MALHTWRCVSHLHQQQEQEPLPYPSGTVQAPEGGSVGQGGSTRRMLYTGKARVLSTPNNTNFIIKYKYDLKEYERKYLNLSYI